MCRSMSPRSTSASTRRATSSRASATRVIASSGRAELAALAHREDPFGDQTVRLFVDFGRILGGRRLHQAERLARLFIDPIAQVLHAVFVLCLQVGGVRAGDVLDLQARGKLLVYIHE